MSLFLIELYLSSFYFHIIMYEFSKDWETNTVLTKMQIVGQRVKCERLDGSAIVQGMRS